MRRTRIGGSSPEPLSRKFYRSNLDELSYIMFVTSASARRLRACVLPDLVEVDDIPPGASDVEAGLPLK
jgi:hypothetical protein